MINLGNSETINESVTNVAQQETATTQVETVIEEEEDEAIENELYNALGNDDPFILADNTGAAEQATVLPSQNNTLGSPAGVMVVVAAVAVLSVIDLIVSYIAVLKSK
ncbi:MAG: hypothetical protein K2L48_03810 [Mycoplasmoidaceae bacterium]|nr:hypothetical protein [Mycoplasmoidaceae bacterium]